MRELSPSGVCPRTKMRRRRRPRSRAVRCLAKLASPSQADASLPLGEARRLAATTSAARGGFAGRRGGQEKGHRRERGRRREKGGVSEPSPSLRSRRRRQPPFFWGRKGIRECCGCVDDFGTARVRGKWPARFDIGLKFWPRQRGKDATAKSVTDI